MMEKCLLLFLTICFSHSVVAQGYFTRSGIVSFFSDAPMEKIQSSNQQVNCRLDPETGTLDFAMLIQAFQFERELMHKHFNEDYLESRKYPTASFEGEILNIGRIDFSTDGKHQVLVRGTLRLHGQAKDINEKGSLIIENGLIRALAKFSINLEDFQIKVPVILKDKIARTIQVEVDVDFSRP
jgi:hypothetical protein